MPVLLAAAFRQRMPACLGLMRRALRFREIAFSSEPPDVADQAYSRDAALSVTTTAQCVVSASGAFCAGQSGRFRALVALSPPAVTLPCVPLSCCPTTG